MNLMRRIYHLPVKGNLAVMIRIDLATDHAVVIMADQVTDPAPMTVVTEKIVIEADPETDVIIKRRVAGAIDR